MTFQFLPIFISAFLGIVIGVLLSRWAGKDDIDQAVEQAKQEAEAKNADVAADLAEQFSEMRAQLLGTLKAYDSAVKVIEEKLPEPSRPVPGISSPVKLELSMDLENVQEGEHSAKDQADSEDSAKELDRSEQPEPPRAPIESVPDERLSSETAASSSPDSFSHEQPGQQGDEVDHETLGTSAGAASPNGAPRANL